MFSFVFSQCALNPVRNIALVALSEREKNIADRETFKSKIQDLFLQEKAFSGFAHHIADHDRSRMKSSGNIFFRPGKSR